MSATIAAIATVIAEKLLAEKQRKENKKKKKQEFEILYDID